MKSRRSGLMVLAMVASAACADDATAPGSAINWQVFPGDIRSYSGADCQDWLHGRVDVPNREAVPFEWAVGAVIQASSGGGCATDGGPCTPTPTFKLSNTLDWVLLPRQGSFNARVMATWPSRTTLKSDAPKGEIVLSASAVDRLTASRLVWFRGYPGQDIEEPIDGTLLAAGGSFVIRTRVFAGSRHLCGSPPLTVEPAVLAAPGRANGNTLITVPTSPQASWLLTLTAGGGRVTLPMTVVPLADINRITVEELSRVKLGSTGETTYLIKTWSDAGEVVGAPIRADVDAALRTARGPGHGLAVLTVGQVADGAIKTGQVRISVTGSSLSPYVLEASVP